MRSPIQTSDFTFVPQRTEVTIFFRGVPVYEFTARQVTKESNQDISRLVEAYNTQNHYEVPCRKIREVVEGRKFPATYDSFDAYVADWPEAESFRPWITNNGRRQPKFIQTWGDYNALPGGYFWVSVQVFEDAKGIHGYGVSVNDNDDTSCSHEAQSLEEAESLRNQVLGIAPATMEEICQLLEFSWG